MRKYFGFFNLWLYLTTILFAQIPSTKTEGAKTTHPRIAVRLMVEDQAGDNQWYSCVIKTEGLEQSEVVAWNLKKWARCEITINSLLYRFAVTKDRQVPSSFFFFAVQVPDEPNHPPSLAQLSGTFVPPTPEQSSGHIEWGLSHHDPYFFVMYINPFADEASFQKWAGNSLEKNRKLNLIIGPFPY